MEPAVLGNVMNGTWIKLLNSLDCQLTSHFVKEGSDVTAALVTWLREEMIILDAGDKLVFEEGWSEE
jgi:hypothetical protein